MVCYERNWCYFSFKGIFWSRVNNWGKCLNLFAVLFIGEEWLSLFTLLNSEWSMQLYSKMLMKVGEKTLQKKIFLDKVAKIVLYEV